MLVSLQANRSLIRRTDTDFANSGSNQSRRQALFADFSTRVVSLLEAHYKDSTQRPPLVLLTGGLRTAEMLTDALASGHADLLGIGRLSVICPDLPTRLVDHVKGSADQNANFIPQDFLPSSSINRVELALAETLDMIWNLVPTFFRPRLPSLIGAGVEMARYNVAIRSLARGNKVPETSKGIPAAIRMWLYLSPGSHSTHTLERRLIWAAIAGAYLLSALLVAWAMTMLR